MSAEEPEERTPLSSEQSIVDTPTGSLRILDFSEECGLKEPLKQAALAEHAAHQSSGDTPDNIINFSDHIVGAELLSDDDLEFVNAAGVSNQANTAHAWGSSTTKRRLDDSPFDSLDPDGSKGDDVR